MSSLKVLSQDSQVEDAKIDLCVTCPKLCRWACPVAEAEARETSTPWNLVNISGYVKKGLVSIEDLGALPYHCSHCGACTDVCLHKNDVAGLMTLARQRVLDAGLAPPKVQEVQGHFAVAGNPYGLDLALQVQAMVEGLEQGALLGPTPGAILYQPGCASIHEHPDSVRAFLRVLSIYGIEDVRMNADSARCCGLPLLWSGDINGFRAHAERNAACLSKAETVVGQDPACVSAMRSRYQDVGVKIDAEVLHVSEFLSQRLGDGRVSRNKNEIVSVAYAECCSLPKSSPGETNPQELIEAWTDVNMMALPLQSGRAGDCCGAAGLLPLTSPSTAEAMASSRILAFTESRAETLVSLSPRCVAHLKRMAPKLDIVDGMELIARDTL